MGGGGGCDPLGSAPAYLVIFVLNGPDLTICTIFKADNWGIQNVLSRMQFACLSNH